MAMTIVDPQSSTRHRLPFPDRYSVMQDVATRLDGQALGEIIDALREKASSEGGTLPLQVRISVVGDTGDSLNLLMQPFRSFSRGTEWRISIADKP